MSTITNALTQADLRMPPTVITKMIRNRNQVAKRVFQLAASGGFPYTGMTYQQWAKKWLPSEKFRLVEIDIHAAASAHLPKNPERVAYRLMCAQDSVDPIVVDLNKQQIGKSHLGFIPKVVVTDGKHRKQGQILQGHTRILAWVGCRAEKHLKNVKVIDKLDFSAIKPQKDTKPVIIQASGMRIASHRNLPIDTAYNLHCAVTPASGQTFLDQSGGEGGSRPKSAFVKAKKVKAGGPGSGRHKENHDELIKNGWEVTKSNSAGKQYQHMLHRGMYINRDTGAWGFRNPGQISKSTDSGRDLASLKTHLTTHPEPSEAQKKWAKGEFDAMGGPGASLGGGSGSNPLTMRAKKIKSNRDCNACGNSPMSMGMIEDESASDPSGKVPSASDQTSRTAPSDQRQYLYPKQQIKAPGAKGWSGGNNNYSPGSGVGPRVARSTGATRSEMSRLADSVPTIQGKGLKSKGKIIDKIWTKAPPGWSEETMHKLKSKHGTESAFKIAWSAYNEGKDESEV